ncbi:hypothetical protein J6590_049748 [Homalodisca vitripennis]|nr:hypothetical protein J6590_049748 [Homalodisca vitripennis]
MQKIFNKCSREFIIQPIVIKQDNSGDESDDGIPSNLPELHRHTQNPIESFHNIVWVEVPKRVFVRIDTLKLIVYDAVLSFNDDQSSKLEVYKKLDLILSEKCVSALRVMDLLRQKKVRRLRKV